jgi:hypothetical protein
MSKGRDKAEAIAQARIDWESGRLTWVKYDNIVDAVASDLDALESARAAAKELRKSLDSCDALSRAFAGHPGETDTSMHRLVALLLDGKGER